MYLFFEGKLLSNMNFRNLYEYKGKCEASDLFLYFRGEGAAYIEMVKFTLGADMREKQKRITATVCI